MHAEVHGRWFACMQPTQRDLARRRTEELFGQILEHLKTEWASIKSLNLGKHLPHS